MSIFANAETFAVAALELGEIPTKKFAAVRTVMDGLGEAAAKDWQRNAEETAGTHARRYPPTIDSERKVSLTGVAVEIGPNPAKGLQAKLGPILEFGSENNLPTFAGLRALNAMSPRVMAALDAAMAF